MIMFKRSYKFIFFMFSVILLIYLGLANPEYPRQINKIKTMQSNEPGDSESVLRRGYYTDASRFEVLDYYSTEFSRIMGITVPTYRLNYPPEEAQILIRDQTRSTFLEEIVHPMRESLFINGFEPGEDKDAIIINNIDFKQKITVKYFPSNLSIRVTLATLLIIAIWLFNQHLFNELSLLYRFIKKYGSKHNNY